MFNFWAFLEASQKCFSFFRKVFEGYLNVNKHVFSGLQWSMGNFVRSDRQKVVKFDPRKLYWVMWFDISLFIFAARPAKKSTTSSVLSPERSRPRSRIGVSQSQRKCLSNRATKLIGHLLLTADLSDNLSVQIKHSLWGHMSLATLFPKLWPNYYTWAQSKTYFQGPLQGTL